MSKIYVYGDNVDTDVIIAARYLNDPDERNLAAHCMEDIDPQFSSTVEVGDIIVGGANFGCGSRPAASNASLPPPLPVFSTATPSISVSPSWSARRLPLRSRRGTA